MIRNPRIRPVGKGYSFFEFINEFCLEECNSLSVNRALHRLTTLMRKMDVHSCVIEDLSSSYSDISDECSALKTFYGQEIELIAYRITFIAEEITSLSQLPSVKADNFLSSAIIINFTNPATGNWKSYLFSAIVALPRINNHEKFGTIPLMNNYVHIFKTFPCEVSMSDSDMYRFQISGTFFCQQNSVTSVCAHATLCMTINNMNLPSVGIISPEHINKIIGIDHNAVRFGKHPSKEGLSKEEILKVLEQYGLAITWTDFFENPNVEYNDYIYRYLESRCPVLLVFSTSGTTSHIVPVLGHTLNSDMWRPEAAPAYSNQGSRLNYQPASAWTDHFIIHDDNFGMYFCLPVDALKRVTLPKYDPSFRAIFAVVVIPSGVTTPAWEAEWASVVIVKDILGRFKAANISLDRWSERIISSDSAGRPIVVRTFLLKKEDYIKSLNEKDFNGNTFSADDIRILTESLPSRFWLSEITLPDLYAANKSKIIDFFYDCELPDLSNTDDIFSRWLQVRFPYVALKKDTNGKPIILPLSVQGHYPLLRLDTTQDLLDW